MSNTQPPRWRSPRRRSNEKSARAIHREWVASGRPFPSCDLATSLGALLYTRSAYTPPHWLVKGVTVHYHPDIFGPATRFWCEVLETPWRLHGAGWVTLVTGVRGYVLCEALSQSPASPDRPHNHRVGA